MWIDGRGSDVLPRPECLRLMALAAKEDAVGRLGFVPAGREQQPPVVVPVNFRVHDEEVEFRIGPGLLARSAVGHLVSFEVDRVDRSAGEAWSVLVRGFARLAATNDRSARTTATPLVPEPGDMVLTLRGDLVTGRRFPLVRASDTRDLPQGVDTGRRGGAGDDC